MTEPEPLRGVIFDMDGVLCDSEPLIREAACRMFRQRHGVAVAPADFDPFTGTGEDRFLGGVAETFGVELDMPADKDWTYEAYLELIRGRLTPLPGAVAFIEACREAGLQLAVASSADRVKVDGNLEQIGLPPRRFDALVCGNDVEKKKPDPSIFQLAADIIGLPPSACLVVEDAPSGIEAARRAGALSLGVCSSFSARSLQEAGAEWTCPDLAHVPAGLLERLGVAGKAPQPPSP